MTSLLFKLITFPLGVLLASWLFPNVDYAAFYQPLLVGIIAAAVGVALEYVILRRGTLWISTFSDLIVGWVLIYMVSSLLFKGAYVTIWGALATSAIIAVVDYFIHYYLLKKGLAKKHA